MTPTRRLLVWLLAGTAALAAAVLWEVLGTVFFAVTVVYVVAPVYRLLVDRGLAPWWASLVTTLLVSATALIVFAPFVVVIYQRRRDVVQLLETLPETVAVAVGEFEYVLVVGDVMAVALQWLRVLAFELASAAPVLGIKLTLFGVVVFALLIRKEAAGRALLAAVSWRHRQLVRRLNDRVRKTLLAIYVLQAATGVGTFLIAFAVFWLLGYPFVLVLALLSGLLQFLPVVGPSLIVVLLVVGELVAGNAQKAVLVGVVGWFFVAWLPDLVIRPRLAERTADMPGGLYFIGFIGGLLTLGPVGIIAGPVAVALVQEALALLAAETEVAPEGEIVESD